jgi:hypothetical protein
MNPHPEHRDLKSRANMSSSLHGLCSSMDSTWRPLMEKFCILLWQAGR